MSFEWEDFLEIAEYLYKNQDCPEEAALRTAISRAYYSVFCLARNKADSTGDIELEWNGSDHARVIDYYNARSGLRKIADYLRDLRGWRNMCDYDNDSLKRLDMIFFQAKCNADRIIDMLEDFSE